MLLYLADDKSILVQVMAWCRQATSHYLSQCGDLSRHMALLGPSELMLWLLRARAAKAEGLKIVLL